MPCYYDYYLEEDYYYSDSAYESDYYYPRSSYPPPYYYSEPYLTYLGVEKPYYPSRRRVSYDPYGPPRRRCYHRPRPYRHSINPFHRDRDRVRVVVRTSHDRYGYRPRHQWRG